MLRKMKRTNVRGDTIIEVLFAITVFSMVAIAGLSIMNQGTASAQRSLEVTLARHQMDAQAEAIRFIYDAYMAEYAESVDSYSATAQEWIDIRGDTVDAALPFGELSDGRCLPSSAIDRSFVVDPVALQVYSDGFADPTTYSRLVYNQNGTLSQSEGLWVQAVGVDGSGDQPGYIDFHIRTCWDSPGQDMPVTLGTIVRLYDPAI